ncbi:hypothetical protein [Streptomyces heilongjiangensis]|uniref:LigA protein n=1 Tax=Streptomyces heilongjiangensis TaxID=945052 RepID=A0ABW1B1Q5_9ACTN|nr:hypothetical protein [Streptomyces heilongjiangensis]MDC2945688.1 hypothetical protein [Streptomyces heilongjiangensis]
MPVDQRQQHDDPFEGRIGDALRRAGDSFVPDGHALVGGGAARGRRLLFRRRAAVLGGVAGIALIGLGGALLPGGTGDGVGRSVAASDTPRDDDGEVSGADLVRTLKRLMPEGEFSREQSRGTGAKEGPYARVVYDDGEGAAAVQVGLSRIDPRSDEALRATRCPDTNQGNYDSCRSDELEDGSTLMVHQGYAYTDRSTDRSEDVRLWVADVVTPQGYHVSVSEWNAPAEKGVPVTRKAPPLPRSELADIATHPYWIKAIEAMPGDRAQESAAPEPSSGSADAPGIGGDAVRATLVRLVPQGLKVVLDGTGQTDYAYLVLDDGKGRSLVQASVQPGGPTSLFGPDAETLPDGKKVVTRQGPGEKGGEGVVMWTVEVLRPDGIRVAVSAFNSGAQHSAATRGTPALTMAQLKDIATSDEWAGIG